MFQMLAIKIHIKINFITKILKINQIHLNSEFTKYVDCIRIINCLNETLYTF